MLLNRRAAAASARGATCLKGSFVPCRVTVTSRPPRSALRAMATIDPTHEKKVLVPVANGTEEMEAVIVIDVLRRAGAHVTVASVESGHEVVCSRNVKLVADVLIKDCTEREFDLIACPVRCCKLGTLARLVTAQLSARNRMGLTGACVGCATSRRVVCQEPSGFGTRSP